MPLNKTYVEKVIKHRTEMKDPVKEYATRNKDSPLNVWCNFKPFIIDSFNNIFNTNIDGVKLKFKSTTLTINSRHKNS